MKKTKYISSVVAVLLACLDLQAQTPTWHQYVASDAHMQVTGFGNDGSRVVIKDSLFTTPVMTIAKVVRKIGAAGAIDWSILFKGKDIISGIKVNQVITDGAGNNYLLGSVKGTVYYLTDSLKSTFNASANIYVAKISSTGTIDWQWNSTHDDASFAGDDEAIRGVLKGDKLFITGNAKGRSLSIGTFSFPRTQNNTMYKMFVASLNTSGVVQWAALTKNGSIYAKSIDIDGSDNVYVGATSAGNGTVEFGNSVTLAVYDNFHFAVKFNASGAAQTVKTAVVGRSGSDLKSVSVDAGGNMYFTGFNDGWESVINGITVRPNVGYVVKLDNTGALAWLRTHTATLKTNGVQYGKVVNGKLYVIINPVASMYVQTNATDSVSKSDKGVIAGVYTSDGTLEWNGQGADAIISSNAGIIETTPDNNNLCIGGTFIQGEKFGTIVLPTPGTNGAYHTGYVILKPGSGGSTGVEKVGQAGAQIYPNPATNHFSVNLKEETEKAAVKVFNIQGVEVIAEQVVSATESINIDHLTPGLYVVQVNISGVVSTQKIIKQ